MDMVDLRFLGNLLLIGVKKGSEFDCEGLLDESLEGGTLVKGKGQSSVERIKRFFILYREGKREDLGGGEVEG